MNAEIDVNKIPKRILNSLLLSVSAGVVPRIGAPYIAIGRQDEISALLSDLEQINEGAGTMRFIIGRYGSGKSFGNRRLPAFAHCNGNTCNRCQKADRAI